MNFQLLLNLAWMEEKRTKGIKGRIWHQAKKTYDNAANADVNEENILVSTKA